MPAPAPFPPYALIVGNGRSGTNWLLSMVAASPYTHCRNEPHDIPSSPFHQLPDAVTLRANPDLMADRWQAFVTWTATHMGERDPRLTSPKVYLHPLAQQLGLADFPVRPKIRQALKVAMPSLRQAEWPVPWWIGNQSKLAQAYPLFKINDLRAWIIKWLLEYQPEIPILHIVRHPGGQLNSGISRFFKHLSPAMLEQELHLYRGILTTALEVDPHWQGIIPDPQSLDLLEAVAWFWRYNNEETYALAQTHPHYTCIVYENLVQDPLAYARQIYDLCGLPLTPEVEAYIMEGTKTSVWGKLEQSSVAVADNWKTKLKPEYQALADRVLEGSALASWWP